MLFPVCFPAIIIILITRPAVSILLISYERSVRRMDVLTASNTHTIVTDQADVLRTADGACRLMECCVIALG